MDSSGLIQIVLYLVLLTALTPITRRVHGARLQRREDGGHPRVIGPLERGIYRVCGVDPAREQHWTGYAAALAGVQPAGRAAALRDPAAPGVSAAQSRRDDGHDAGSRLQHGGQLHHQHQLAVLQRRSGAELSEPDGRADGAELRVRRDRHGRPGGADPGLFPPQRPDGRQFLGRYGARHPLRAAAAVDRHGAVPGLAGRAAEPQRLCHGRDGRRRAAGHRPRSCRFADRDQADRLQRRRLLRHQLGPSVRKPDAAEQSGRNAPDPADRVGPDLDVRAHGRRSPPGSWRCSPRWA